MTDNEDRLSKSTALGMIAMAVAVFVVANDFTALSVAIPAIEKAFGTDDDLPLKYPPTGIRVPA